tara:strand:- start:962 stop:1096 length:135 start_codon:yes stop_codon:yes gene_type:complete
MLALLSAVALVTGVIVREIRAMFLEDLFDGPLRCVAFSVTLEKE